MRSFFLFLLFSLLLTPAVHAEKADANKPTNIEADQMLADDVKQVTTFIGNVVLTKGTLTIKAGKVTVRQDPEGYQFVVLYAAPGKLASLREKRDGGGDLWVEGYGERIEYDTKSQVVKFFTRARLKRLEGSRATDEITGEYISYDSKTEFVRVNNTAAGVSEPKAGRVKAVIQPRNKK